MKYIRKYAIAVFFGGVTSEVTNNFATGLLLITVFVVLLAVRDYQLEKEAG